VAARGNAGVGDYFLEAVEHERSKDVSDQKPGSLGWWMLKTFYNEMGS